MPPSSEVCDIPSCDGTNLPNDVPRPDARRQVKKDRIDAFRDGPVISLAANSSENEIGSNIERSFSHSGAGGWLYTEWSEVDIDFVTIGIGITKHN